jgi:hypothetical protein
MGAILALSSACAFDSVEDINRVQPNYTDKDIFDGLKMSTQMVAMTLMVDTLKIPRDF